jgi:hypothetical protein
MSKPQQIEVTELGDAEPRFVDGPPTEDDEGWTIHLVDSAGDEFAVLDLTPEDFRVILHLGVAQVIRQGMEASHGR